MNLPDALYIPDTHRESLTDTHRESLEPQPDEKNRWVALQWECGIDARLKHLDVRVLFILKGTQWHDSPVRLGRRKLAQYACTTQRLLAESIERLRKYGWIETFPPANQRDRMGYKVTPVKFNPPKISADEPVKPAKVRRELVSCPKCGTRCRQILKVGWCRKCNWKREVGKVFDEKVKEKAS